MQDSKANTANNAVKLVGESFVPGASLLLDGRILAGAAHTLIGFAAKAALGPAGVAVVIANSYAQSATGKNLLKQFRSDKSGAATAEPEAKAEEAKP